MATLLNAKGEVKNTTKNYFHTNMDSACVMPTKMVRFDKFIFDFIFPVVGDTLHYFNDDPNQKDMDKFVDSTFFQFRIVDMDMFVLPLRDFTQIKPLKWAVQLKTPITINPYENFSAVLHVKDGLVLESCFDISCMLDGWIRRPY